MRPHRWQPTRLPRPWDSPGKNTGVGCHFLLQCMKVKSESEFAQSCPTQRPHGLKPTRLLHPWDFPGKSTGVGCHCLLQPASISSPKMWKRMLTMAGYKKIHTQAKSLQLCPILCDPMGCSPPGSSIQGILQARILQWVAMSFSRDFSQPRD